MRRSGTGSGGGIGMSKNVSPPVRTGVGSRSARPAGVAQIGQSQGSHVTAQSESRYRGEPLHNERNFQPTKFGNEVALNIGRGGPGSGRTLYGQSGSQGMHGATNPGNPRPNPRHDALEND